MRRLPIRCSRPTQIFTLLGIAVLCGLADAAFVVYEFFDSRAGVEYVPSSIWPWSVAVWLVLGLLAAALTLAIPRRLRDRAMPWVLTALPALLIAARLVRAVTIEYALPPLLTGAAALAGWLAGSYAVRVVTIERSRDAALASGTAMMLLFVLTGVLTTTRESVAQARKAIPDAPDIILIFLDTLRADTAGRMPRLQAFMRRGTAFDAAYAPSAWTLPTHLSAISGETPVEIGVTFGQQRYDGSLTAPVLLRRRGYATIGFGANNFLNEASGFTHGFDSFTIMGRGLDLCRTAPGMQLHRRSAWFNHVVCNGAAASVTQAAVDSLDTTPGPRLLVLNYTDVHDPYYVAPDCPSRAPLTWSEERTFDTARRKRQPLPANLNARLREVYEESAQCLDRSLGRLFARIDDLPGRTVTIVTSDHGEQFGEHGLLTHGNSLYPELVHVPLAVVGTGVPSNRISTPVSLQEIRDLLLHLGTGVKSSRLADLIAGRPAAPLAPTAFLLDRRTNDGKPMAAIVEEGFQLILSDSGRNELYDLTSDPKCLRNLIAEPHHRQRADRLTQRLERERGAKIPSANERLEKLRSLGYLQ
jgi:arylsulfatase A-like enzyme